MVVVVSFRYDTRLDNRGEIFVVVGRVSRAAWGHMQDLASKSPEASNILIFIVLVYSFVCFLGIGLYCGSMEIRYIPLISHLCPPTGKPGYFTR